MAHATIITMFFGSDNKKGDGFLANYSYHEPENHHPFSLLI